MKSITIDCALIIDKAQLHRTLAQELAFPDWYGNNLDALYDCLTDIQEDTTLTLLHFETLDSFRAGFKTVLEDAENDNSHLIVNIR